MASTSGRPQTKEIPVSETITRDVEVEREGVVYQEDIVKSSAARKVLAAFRIVIGFYFLWAFIDKTFGFGFGTPSERAWLNGGSPTAGFLGGATGEGSETNPFRPLFEFFASWGAFADILFMLGLLGIGVAVILGAGLKIAAVSGGLLMLLMYLAVFPLTQGGSNPIFDSHVVEGLALAIFPLTLAGDTWGVGKIWGRMVGNGWLR